MSLAPRNCPFCGRLFNPFKADAIMCSSTCLRRNASEKKAREKVKNKTKSNFTNFSDLHFLSEREFMEWFRLNYSLFGIRRLIKLDCWFPDCRAEMFDGRYLDIELEYHARNFVIHKHDSTGCDLIISFVRGENHERICNLPVISIFIVKDFVSNGDFDPHTKRLTPFFEEIVECGRCLVEETLGNDPDRTQVPDWTPFFCSPCEAGV